MRREESYLTSDEASWSRSRCLRPRHPKDRLDSPNVIPSNKRLFSARGTVNSSQEIRHPVTLSFENHLVVRALPLMYAMFLALGKNAVRPRLCLWRFL